MVTPGTLVRFERTVAAMATYVSLWSCPAIVELCMAGADTHRIRYVHRNEIALVLHDSIEGIFVVNDGRTGWVHRPLPSGWRVAVVRGPNP